MRHDVDNHIRETLRGTEEGPSTGISRQATADIAAIRAQLVRRGSLRHGQHPRHPARSGSAPRRGWSVAVAAAMTVLALAPALRHSAEPPPGTLSRAVQPLIHALPSGTEVQEEIFFVLEATSSYYRDDRRDTIWQE